MIGIQVAYDVCGREVEANGDIVRGRYGSILDIDMQTKGSTPLSPIARA